MHRSSESIAALAAALAKAQITLTNPEKSLTATVRSDRRDDPGRTFRYAPLSSGLEIVRKALGQHEIATLQTTTIDQDIQSVSLTTVLAHSSGEWIASDWPVCLLSDLAAPRRMGAALTYARRYALFTLVGIAGEDDLDAPDLAGQPAERSEHTWSAPGKPNRRAADQPLGSFAKSRKSWSPPKHSLEPEKSAAARDQLLAQLGAVTTPEQATAWAFGAIGAKNALTAADCGMVEAAFASTVAESAGAPEVVLPAPTEALGHEFRVEITSPAPSQSDGISSSNKAPNLSCRNQKSDASLTAGASRVLLQNSAAVAAVSGAPGPVNNAVAWHIDKGALALSEPRRYRDRAHLEFVSSQPCLLCGRRPSDAHHLRFAQPRALGRRVSDEYTVPLCRTHHRGLHRRGDEAAWWESINVDPVAVALDLWAKTRLNGAAVPATLPSGQDQ